MAPKRPLDIAEIRNHDEHLKGERTGQRSSRLSRQYRVIYAVDREVVVVYVLEITPHHY